MNQRSFNLTVTNRWFSADVSYQGQGTVHFASPPAVARGPTTIRVDVQGNASADMDVESFETDYVSQFGDVEVFHPGARRGNVFAPTSRHRNACVGLEVDTGDGLFVAHGPITYGYRVEGQAVKRLLFSVQEGEFTRANFGPAVFWAVPLLNFTFPFRGIHPAIFGHPLRMRKPAPPPPELPLEELDSFRALAASACRIVGFNFDGRAAFIEPLPEYEEITARLQEEGERWESTSLRAPIKTHVARS